MTGLAQLIALIRRNPVECALIAAILLTAWAVGLRAVWVFS